MNQTSQIEIFPDELFLELFSYIHPKDLFYSWNGLNRRINAILRSVSISLDFIENTDEIYQIIKYFSRQIVYIHLRIPFDLTDFQEFSNLRSLIVDTKLTSDQIKSIQPSCLPNLRRLAFSEAWKGEQPLNDIVFERWIKVYHLPSIPNKFLYNNHLKLSHIQTMIFDRVTSCDIHRILTLQPTLRRLKATIVPVLSDEKISKTFLTKPNFQHKYLIDFHPTMNTFNKLDELYPLLSYLSSLRYLNISCDSLNINDFRQLAFELHTRTPQLERLNCTFKQTLIENIDKVHSMSPLFTRMICRRIEWIGGWHYFCVTTGCI